MSRKSDVSYTMYLPFIINNNLQVQLGVLFHSEQCNDEMKEIFKEVYVVHCKYWWWEWNWRQHTIKSFRLYLPTDNWEGKNGEKCAQ